MILVLYSAAQTVKPFNDMTVVLKVIYNTGYLLVKILWTWNIALLVLISFLSFIRVYVPWLWSSLRLICLLTLYCYFRSEATDICVIHFCLAVCIVDSFLAMMWGAFYVMSFMIHFLFQVIEFGRRAPFDASKILPCRLEYVGLSTTEYCFTLPRIVGCTFYVLCSHP